MCQAMLQPIYLFYLQSQSKYRSILLKVERPNATVINQRIPMQFPDTIAGNTFFWAIYLIFNVLKYRNNTCEIRTTMA